MSIELLLKVLRVSPKRLLNFTERTFKPSTGPSTHCWARATSVHTVTSNTDNNTRLQQTNLSRIMACSPIVLRLSARIEFKP